MLPEYILAIALSITMAYNVYELEQISKRRQQAMQKFTQKKIE
jgi:hypothetical protein